MPVFVVHEHHARQLHYDLRLEHSGVLLSWAIPKGPSMDPADKRLAIHVEDHELSYADFEGTIEEGSYGAGEVYVWDKGSLLDMEGSVESGKLEFSVEGAKLKGWFVIFQTERMRNSQDWLLIKKKDGLEERGFKLKPVMPVKRNYPDLDRPKREGKR